MTLFSRCLRKKTLDVLVWLTRQKNVQIIVTDEIIFRIVCKNGNESTLCYDRRSAFAVDDAGAGWEMICLVITGSVLFALNLIIETNLQRYFYTIRDAILRRRKKDKIGMRLWNSYSNTGHLDSEKVALLLGGSSCSLHASISLSL